MRPESWSLDGKVAIVTGGARGIGRATAELLRGRGARVVASDLSQAVHELDGHGYATLTGDVADEDVARRTVALARERFGQLDILVNNAGRTLSKPLLETCVVRGKARGGKGGGVIPRHRQSDVPSCYHTVPAPAPTQCRLRVTSCRGC